MHLASSPSNYIQTRDLSNHQSTLLPRTTAHGEPRSQLISHGKTTLRLSSVNLNRFSSGWIDCNQLLGRSNSSGWSLGKQHTHLIGAFATVEPKCLVPNESDYICGPNIEFGYSSDSQVVQSPNDDFPEIDERERLRRMRISKANKRNVPWNKGRKHSAETLQKIHESTRIAMQDPKVKMKLRNLGHAQSEETRVKISVGVRHGWQRRRERLMVQESCLFEWKNIIAEASRKDYAGEDELKWDSYDILDKQLKKEWLESIEKRKTMPRPKGCKRAPKSLDQKRKISEAISAKWADPEYRNRVCNALAKYHGTPVGVGRRVRSKSTGDTTSVKMAADKKNSAQTRGINNAAKSIPRRRRNGDPSYKDPMASTKLETLKKIRTERGVMETKKREATGRAKLLIAEAEKAAKALELAAHKSSLARASLLETRKLIAEAIRSIASIDNGRLNLQLQDTSDASLSSDGSINHSQTSQGTLKSGISLDRRLVNGSLLISSSDSDYKDFGFDEIMVQNTLSDKVIFSSAKVLEDSGSGYLSPSSQPNNVGGESSNALLQVAQSKINGCIGYGHRLLKKEEDVTLEVKEGKSSTISPTKTKKWVCGRLVDVGEV